MRTAKIILIAFLFFIFVFPQSTKAVGLDPASYTPAGNETKEFRLLAAPPEEGMIGLQLRLTVTDATIVNYVPPTNIEGIPVIGTCGNGSFFTENSICADFATATTLTEGLDLGTLTIKFGDNGQGAITKGADNGYLNTDFVLVYDSGELFGQVEVTTVPTTTTTPNSNGDALNTMMAVLLITIGLVLISVAIVLVAKHHKTQKDENKTE